MMNLEEKIALKEKIEFKMFDLRDEIKDLEDSIQPLPLDNTLSTITRMDAVNNLNINEDALRIARTRLFRLENILNNIEGPHFGVCVSCRMTIPFKRILAIPESLICVDCADET